MSRTRSIVSELEALGVSNGRAVVAVSGGTDSLALLDLAAAAAVDLNLTLVVGHFDHGIHPESGAVAAQVAAVAERLGLRVVIGSEKLGAGATETRARVARIRWLETIRREIDAGWILTGHHRDDQIETTLMRFLKGSGASGLAGILPRRGVWVRPVLEWSRAELADHAAEAGLTGWLDPSNQDPRHLRGWIRTELLPLLEARLPAIRTNLAQGQQGLADNRMGWDRLVDELPGLDFQLESNGGSVAVDSLDGYSSAVVRGVLRAVGFRLGIQLGRGSLARIQALVAQGHNGRRVDISGRGVATLGGGRLGLFPPSAHLSFVRRILGPAPSRLQVGEWSIAVMESAVPDVIERLGYRTWVRPDAEIEVRWWQPGDRIRPLGGQGSRLVVRCMQDEKISRVRRPSWPVFVVNDEVIWVPGVCRSGAALPEPGTRALRIDAGSG